MAFTFAFEFINSSVAILHSVERLTCADHADVVTQYDRNDGCFQVQIRYSVIAKDFQHDILDMTIVIQLCSS
jgi:hypothetical protein